MEWTAVAAIGTIAIGGLGLMGGFFGWLSKKLDGISAHLGKQDTVIAEIKTDIAWLKREIDGKADREDT